MAAKITRLLQPASPTIDQVFDEFLAEQRKRLRPRTLSKHEDVLGLLWHHLNGYASESLSKAESAFLVRQVLQRKGGRAPGILPTLRAGQDRRELGGIPRVLHDPKGHSGERPQAGGGHGHEEAVDVARGAGSRRRERSPGRGRSGRGGGPGSAQSRAGDPDSVRRRC